MDREPVTIPSATTLVNAEEEFFLRYRQPWFAVVDEARHYVGLLRSERLEAELHGGRPALTAGEVSDDERPWRIGPGQTLEDLLGSDGLRRLGRRRRRRPGRNARRTRHARAGPPRPAAGGRRIEFVARQPAHRSPVPK